MKVYTRKGDAGKTSLVSGERVDKDDCRLNAYGTLDELSAFIGHLYDRMSERDPKQELFAPQRDQLLRVLNQLMGIESVLACSDAPLHKQLPSVVPQDIAWIEAAMDAMDLELSPIFKFTLPCGDSLVSLAHLCRTVCRRAEREIVSVVKQHDVPLLEAAYVNRLSDYLYVLSRYLSLKVSAQEIQWIPSEKSLLGE